MHEKSREETFIENLTDQLAQAVKAAEAEGEKCKAEKDALEKKVTQLGEEKVAAEKERDKLKAANDALNATVNQITRERDAAQVDRDKYNAESQRLREEGAVYHAASKEHAAKMGQLALEQIKELRVSLAYLRLKSKDGVLTLTSTLTC